MDQQDTPQTFQADDKRQTAPSLQSSHVVLQQGDVSVSQVPPQRVAEMPQVPQQRTTETQSVQPPTSNASQVHQQQVTNALQEFGQQTAQAAQPFQAEIMPGRPIHQVQPAQTVPSYPQQPVQMTQSAQVQVAKGTSGLGVASLVLGIISFLTSFVPLFNIGCIPFALLGVILGIVGMVSIRQGKVGGQSVTVTGLVLCALALVITAVMYASVFSGDSSNGAAGDRTTPVAASEDSAATGEEADDDGVWVADAQDEQADAGAGQNADREADTDANAGTSASDDTYESVYNEYAAKLQEATPQLVDEYNAECGGLDLQGKADLVSEKITQLAAIETEGTEKMAVVMMYSGGGYEDYETWAMKLYGVYEEQAMLLMDAYMASAM